MWNNNLSIMMAFLICLALHLSIPHHSVFGQADNTTGIFTPNNNMSTGMSSNTTGMSSNTTAMSSNTTGIMENTSGIIDDAFDALKDSFGTFFGK
jgi:hypothetical protein